LEDRLAPTVVTSPGNQMAIEGFSASFNLGSFSDTNSLASSWTVDVNWGDGSTDTMFTVTSQGPLGTAFHAYADEGFATATITVTDNLMQSGSATFQVTVSDPN